MLDKNVILLGLFYIFVRVIRFDYMKACTPRIFKNMKINTLKIITERKFYDDEWMIECMS